MSAVYPKGYQKNRKVERLSQKLKGFSVKTLNGILLGHVIDVLASQKGEPEILVSLPEELVSSEKFFFLKTNAVKQVNVTDRLLLVPETPGITQLISHAYSSKVRSDQTQAGEDSEITLPLNSNPQPPAKIVEEATISLKAEKVVVERERKKVGEVVVRKEVETEYIQVPVKREKLIIEQIGEDESKRLAEIPLSQQIIKSEFD